ncbi:hypothetical protein BDN70DRAFT_937433 [Pholiota conissans]|uniref:Uncharacterized protein n=1 Tax=Pholiota conissans TaxID=109636 RepID=A0A9P5YQU9_9AGAR|nr:hypothetical protein BDN70DRAFT_937433 [Pholiota conissans]
MQSHTIPSSFRELRVPSPQPLHMHGAFLHIAFSHGIKAPLPTTTLDLATIWHIRNPFGSSSALFNVLSPLGHPHRATHVNGHTITVRDPQRHRPSIRIALPLVPLTQLNARMREISLVLSSALLSSRLLSTPVSTSHSCPGSTYLPPILRTPEPCSVSLPENGQCESPLDQSLPSDKNALTVPA